MQWNLSKVLQLQICHHILADTEVTNNLNKFCQWWRKQCHTADTESSAMSGLSTAVAGHAAPTRIHDRISSVTNNQSITASRPLSAINFGSVPSLSHSHHDHSGMTLYIYIYTSSDSYDPLWGNSTSDNHIPPM